MADGDLGKMKSQAVAVGVLGAITLTTMAVVTEFKNTNLVDNATADNFVTGLAIFGTFVAVLALAIVGKAVIGLFSKN